MQFKSLKIAGLCLASMLAMGMALVGNAAGALLWLVCLKGSGLTKYTNSKCSEASSSGEWQSLGVPSGKEVTVKILVISLLLKDSKTTIGEVVANCPNEGSRGEMVIKANGEGQIRAFEYTAAGAKKCKDEKGNCPEFTKVEGRNLPWITNIEEGPNKEPLTTLKPHTGGGQPGWAITCKALFIEETDECKFAKAGEEEKLKLVNTRSATELLVASLWEEKSKIECSQSKEITGEVKGTLAVLLPGGALSINRT